MSRKLHPQDKSDTPVNGALLRQARQAKGITLTRMATLLSVTKGHLSGIETGRVKPTLDLLQKYEQALELLPGELSERKTQEESIPSCEVVILTALRVERQAVLHYLQNVQEIVHPSGIIYDWGRFPGESHIWSVVVANIGAGNVSAALETERAIHYFHPSIALSVGLAGGLKDVEIGDVVVGTEFYYYESGKAGERFEPRPGVSVASHKLEQYALAAARSAEWLARLDGSAPGHRPQVIFGPLASGEKVIASKDSEVFGLLKAKYGDVLAVEMEGHGFLQAVHTNDNVHGLVIRGISDVIADKQRYDASEAQAIAVRHAAAFAFQVLAKMTQPSEHDSFAVALTQGSSLVGIGGMGKTQLAVELVNRYKGKEPIWNVPFARNPFFTGRDQELEQLHEQLQQGTTAVVGQVQSISGLGGVGKTQLAVEYAYRYQDEYQYVLWGYAENVGTLSSSFAEIAHLLNLPEKDAQEQAVRVQDVKRWLQKQPGWLLILDNADDPALLSDFLPPTVKGHLLITTRAADVSAHLAGLAHPLTVKTFSDEQGALFLLHRSGLLALDATLDQAEPHTRQLAYKIVQVLGGLPLALAQAGAYLEATASSLATYWQLYQQRHAELLAQRRGVDHPEPVATTWTLSLLTIEQQNPAAAELLRFCAFLAPDPIPDVILTKGAKELGPVLAPVAADAYLLNEAIECLRAHSLIVRDPQEQTLIVHRLVQTIQRDSMTAETQQQWIQRAVNAIAAVFAGTDVANRSAFERILPHALVCATWIEQVPLITPTAALLLSQIAQYLSFEQERSGEAELLYKRALAMYEQTLGSEHPNTQAAFTALQEAMKQQLEAD